MKPLNFRVFSLIEVLTAVFLVAVTCVVLFSSVTAGINFIRRIVELRTATLVLQEEISKTRDLSFSDVESLSGNFNSTGMSSLKNSFGTIHSSPYDGESGIRAVSIKITWDSFTGEVKEKTLVTLITENGIDKK